jgi:hypothetical protein
MKSKVVIVIMFVLLGIAMISYTISIIRNYGKTENPTPPAAQAAEYALNSAAMQFYVPFKG